MPDTTPPPEPLTRLEPRVSAQSVCLIILAVLAVFTALSVTADVVLPFLLAVVLNLLLQPAMRLLRQRLRLPGALAALLLIALLFGAVIGVGAAISVPASSWVARIPDGLPRLIERLAPITDMFPPAKQALDQLAGLLHQDSPDPVAVARSFGISLPSAGNFGLNVLLGTQHFFGRLFTLLILLFFLLASGGSLQRNLVEVMPTQADKRRVVRIAQEIERNISGYLVTITLMNLLVGLLCGVASWICGLSDPLLWGTLAFLLNYIPILGPLSGVVIFFFVGLFTFDRIWLALVPPGAYLLIHVLEGETLTPMLLARRFTLNPVIIIVSLFFWDWLWGIPGALLSVPLLAICKIVCDHISSLAPLGQILAAPKPGTRERGSM